MEQGEDGVAVPTEGLPMSAGRSRPSRWARIAGRVAVSAALVALFLFAAPGPASATGTVRPLLDCVKPNSNGSITAVLGYSNTTGRSQTIPFGYNNVITPSTYDKVQPTTYRSGTYHGVFAVTIAQSDFRSDPTWRLNGDVINYLDVTSNPCPPGTTMPSVGNGTGAAIGLGVAGVLGVFLIRRYVRRAQAAAPTLEDTRA